ncbi:hypothetical protein HYH03_005998 [Edaphochlamys debaryana]|uniref:Uncharacterized protein n=1 Tax=Edaphochlamys debaryana TaxID=47281 RepID=A0A835Y4R1_9CHLO|nr:hypothetical protein HYH03_005998 [Edaphochlamys debaryana]|eukprot:KAG2496080.1 hypothetical protein HYH03_005998 [Edaphochlamys debaryana]
MGRRSAAGVRITRHRVLLLEVILGPGARASWTIIIKATTATGTFPVRCGIHGFSTNGGMQGTISVRPPL